jgi:hypothetical protein
MKGINFYESHHGTNREMTAEIMAQLFDAARNGDDLKEQKKVIDRQWQKCWNPNYNSDDPEGSGDEEDEDEDEALSSEVQVYLGHNSCSNKIVYSMNFSIQDRLELLSATVRGLTKSYLKQVMNEIGCYGSGTNRDMAEAIVISLESTAKCGGDLKEEKKIIKSIDPDWGCCADDADSSNEGEDEE